MTELTPRIALGAGLVLLYLVVLQPLIVRAFYPPASRAARLRRRADLALPVLLSLVLLALPLLVPRDLTVVRLFYAMMAVTTIQKLVSYVRERGGTASPEDGRREFFDFMGSYTTNITELPSPLPPGASHPDPGRLRMRAVVKLSIPAVVAALNLHLGLWRYTPPLAATLVKLFLFIVVLSAQQDLVRAGLVRKGLRPSAVLVDRRLFWPRTYAEALARFNPITHRWLYRYVYRPLGGGKHPLRNVMFCYGLSGLWHEYLLSAASTRISGMWLAFFAVSGLIACGERVLLPDRMARPRGTVLAAALPIGNLVLNVCVAHLFMLGLEQVIRFH